MTPSRKTYPCRKPKEKPIDFAGKHVAKQSNTNVLLLRVARHGVRNTSVVVGVGTTRFDFARKHVCVRACVRKESAGDAVDGRARRTAQGAKNNFAYRAVPSRLGRLLKRLAALVSPRSPPPVPVNLSPVYVLCGA